MGGTRNKNGGVGRISPRCFHCRVALVFFTLQVVEKNSLEISPKVYAITRAVVCWCVYRITTHLATGLEPMLDDLGGVALHPVELVVNVRPALSRHALGTREPR